MHVAHKKGKEGPADAKTERQRQDTEDNVNILSHDRRNDGHDGIGQILSGNAFWGQLQGAAEPAEG